METKFQSKMKTIGYLEITTSTTSEGNLVDYDDDKNIKRTSSTFDPKTNTTTTTTTTTIAITASHNFLFYIKLFGVLLFLSLPTLFGVFFCQRFTHPPWYYETARTPQQGLNYNWGSINWMTFRNNPLKDHNFTFHEVEFDGPYGSTLRGWYIPADPKFNSTIGIVGVHGAGLDRREFLKQTPILHNEGYNILLFDCREHGVSTGSFRGFSFGLREHADVIHAVKYLRNAQNMTKVAVVGTSQGATSTILAAAIDETIDAVVLENPFTSVDEMLTDVIDGLLNSKPDWTAEAGIVSYIIRLGDYIPNWYRSFLKQVTILKTVYFAGEGNLVNAIDVIDKLKQPVFLIHGSSDSLIPLKHTLKLYKVAKEPKELWVADGCEHAAIYNKYPKEYAEKITAFLHKHL